MNHKKTFTPALRKLVQQPFCRLFAVFVLVMLGWSTAALAQPCSTPGSCTFTIHVIQDFQIADGVQADKVEVDVIDNSTGLAPVPSITITMRLGASAGTAQTTSAAGAAIFDINNFVQGPQNVTFYVNGYQVSATPTTVTFIAGPPSPTSPGAPPGSGTLFYIVTDLQPVGGQDVVSAHITDGTGNAVANAKLRITITGNGTAASTAQLGGGVQTIDVLTNSSGDLVTPVTITDTKVGTVELSATLIDVATGNPIGQINGSTLFVRFVASVPDPSPPGNPPGSTIFFMVTDMQPAGGQDVVNAHISDKYGNPVGNVDVTITITGVGTAAGSASLLPGNVQTIVVKTDINGNLITPVPITSTKTGTVELSATIFDPVTSNPVAPINGSTQTVTFVAAAPSPSPPDNPPGSTIFFTVTDMQPAGGQDVVNAHISDKYGNPVANVDVTITITGVGTAAGSASILPGNVQTIIVKTNANGDLITPVPITSTKIGTVELSATIFDPATSNPVAPINGSTQTVTFVSASASPNPPGNPPGSTLFYIVTDFQPAGGQDAVSAHVSDQFGNPSNGAKLVITITGNGTAAAGASMVAGGQTITVSTKNDNTGDLANPVFITSTMAGTVEVSCVLLDGAGNPIGPINGSTRTITFVAGPASPTAPNAPAGTGTNFYITLDKQPVDGAPDKVMAHITDQYGNALSSEVMVTITITGNGTAAGPAQLPGGFKTINQLTTGGYLEIPITDTKAGTVEISATIIDPATGNPASLKGSTQTVTFVAGTPVPVAPLAPAGTGSQLTVTQDNRIADGHQIDSVKAHITDKYGNPVAGVSVTFTIVPGGTATAGAQLGATSSLVTNANGDIEIAITSTMPGTVNINGAINGTDLVDGSSQTVTFANAPDVNNPLTQLIVVVYEALADGQGQTVVKAHVVDLAGLPIAGQDVIFAIDSGDAKMATPATATTDANGDAYISLTSTKAGFALITATVDGQAIKFGTPTYPARVKFAMINIYVPKVFTPNNDGTNDILKPILVGIKEFHYMSVYNRWGNLIFTTQDPNNGWDGTFKGVAQPVESYLWIAEGIDINGNKIVQKGVTSLVR